MTQTMRATTVGLPCSGARAVGGRRAYEFADAAPPGLVLVAAPRGLGINPVEGQGADAHAQTGRSRLVLAASSAMRPVRP